MAARLKQILPDLNQARAARLMSGKVRYVALETGLTLAQKQATLAFGDPALKLTRSSSRVYPTGNVMAHSVGCTSSDMRGLLGLELYLDRLIEDEGSVLREVEIPSSTRTLAVTLSLGIVSSPL